MKKSSDYLFSTPNFLSGIGRALDMGSKMTSYNSCKNPDKQAMKADFGVVNKDLKKGAKDFYKDTHKKVS